VFAQAVTAAVFRRGWQCFHGGFGYVHTWHDTHGGRGSADRCGTHEKTTARWRNLVFDLFFWHVLLLVGSCICTTLHTVSKKANFYVSNNVKSLETKVKLRLIGDISMLISPSIFKET
jgi:hypothetical protein